MRTLPSRGTFVLAPMFVIVGWMLMSAEVAKARALMNVIPHESGDDLIRATWQVSGPPGSQAVMFERCMSTD